MRERLKRTTDAVRYGFFDLNEDGTVHQDELRFVSTFNPGSVEQARQVKTLAEQLARAAEDVCAHAGERAGRNIRMAKYRDLAAHLEAELTCLRRGIVIEADPARRINRRVRE